jgi:hypothetical protein
MSLCYLIQGKTKNKPNIEDNTKTTQKIFNNIKGKGVKVTTRGPF